MPFDWALALAFYRTRALDGVEQGGADFYRRSLRNAEAVGWITVRPSGFVEIDGPLSPGFVMARVRHAFGLDVGLAAARAHLCADPVLAPLIAARPFMRPPAGWDGFELAIRAVLGQQVTLEAARLLGSRLVAVAGPGHVFPTAAEVLAADLTALGMPQARRRTLWAVAEAAMAGDLFAPEDDLSVLVARLSGIAGIGPWSAHYIALRAFRHPDAFPASDVALLRIMARLDGTERSARALLVRAERWRPYRAFAAQWLWAVEALSRDVEG